MRVLTSAILQNLDASFSKVARTISKSLDRRIDGGTPYDRGAFEALARMRIWGGDSVVVDIGANDGRATRRFHRFLRAPRIYACEPVSETFHSLQQRTADLANVSCFRQAFGAEPGVATIYVNDSSALSSMYPAWGTAEKKETVPVTTIDAFVAANELNAIDLLKVDVEGHDLEVLKGARRTLQNGLVDIIQVEAGVGAPGKTMPSLEDFRQLLQPLNYQLYGVHNQCRGRPQGTGLPDIDQSREILIYCDAVFVRWR